MREAKKGMNLPKKVTTFDTTLRDGEQTPGVSLTSEEKLILARQLDKLGVDIIEAGFPVTSEGEKESVSKIAREGLKASVCGLSRVLKPDIDASLDCDVDMVHTFVSTSDIQIKYTIKKSKDEIVDMAVDAVSYIKDHGASCLFSAMDATRSSLDYLIRIFKAVEEAGADIINIPDTVGVMMPPAMRSLTRDIHGAVSIPIDVHCHNDFGLAVANSLAAVEVGAREVQCTINGLGERAGNANLQEIVMSLYSIYNVKTNIKTQYLFETSRLVERLTGIKMPPNYPIVGENAFSHESGIHTHGVLTKSDTFEPGVMTPEMVGHKRRIVSGKHAGTHGIEAMLSEMGLKVNREQLPDITSRVKDLGDKGKRVTDADLQAIAEAVLGEVAKEEKLISLEELSVMTGNKITPTASVKLKLKDKDIIGADTGVGPVDAALNAVRSVLRDIEDIKLTEYRLEAITGGSDALAEVIVKLEDSAGNLVTARAAREDIVIASVEAMVSGINRIFLMREKE
ncbi:MAG: 2-isopropylmalate synthase [Candidatus Hydrothermarchaeota archaeon]|nr:2-isopropylmalate synthase [Candidatus Hydrothermarchaeota archaeon]